MVRRLTPLQWYACGTCGFRGWTSAELRIHPTQIRPVAAPLQFEVRYLRRDFGRRRSLLRAVLLAACLGAAAGYGIVRAGGAGSVTRSP